MTFDRNDRTGFAPHRAAHRHGRRSTAVAQLITSAALALSISVAVTAVTIGIARADGLFAVAHDTTAHMASVSVLALILVAAGLTGAVKRPGADQGARVAPTSWLANRARSWRR